MRRTKTSKNLCEDVTFPFQGIDNNSFMNFFRIVALLVKKQNVFVVNIELKKRWLLRSAFNASTVFILNVKVLLKKVTHILLIGPALYVH